MSQSHIDVSVHINNTPEAVISYVADVRHRPLFLGPLKSVTDIEGEPAAVGTCWKWTWVALGMEFEGTGECLQRDEGKLYSFKTEGGIASTWTYVAEADNDGTKLSINVDFEVPQNALARVPAEAIAERMKTAEAERVADNLQLILSR